MREIKSKSTLSNYSSFHEIAVYDVPMIIDYILKETRQSQLYYGGRCILPLNNLTIISMQSFLRLGHSMGSNCFFATMSMFPEYNSKIKAFIGLAPAAYVGNASAPFIPIVPTLLIHQVILSNLLE